MRCSTFRHRNRQIYEQSRTLCNTANVEDEFYCVCHCHLYNNLRTQLHEDAVAINTNFFKFTAEDKFVFLLAEATLCKP